MNKSSEAWSVDVVIRGRSGSIIYHEHPHAASFYWEFGGGNAVAIISCAPATTWLVKFPWLAERRSEILDRISKEVVRQKAPECVAEIDDKTGTIIIRRKNRGI